VRKTRFDQLAEREKGIEIAAGLKLRSSLALPSWLRYGLKEYKEQLKYPKTRDKFTWYCHLMRKGPPATVLLVRPGRPQRESINGGRPTLVKQIVSDHPLWLLPGTPFYIQLWPEKRYV